MHNYLMCSCKTTYCGGWPAFCIQLRMSTPVPAPDSSSTEECVSPSVGSGLQALEAALEQFEAGPSLHLCMEVAEKRRAAGDEIAKLNKRDSAGVVPRASLSLLRRLCRHGLLDLPRAEEDGERLAGWSNLGWPGLLASMMITSAWRWQGAPVLSKTPDWIWPDYAEWLFAAPNPLLTTEDCAAYAAHLGRHTDEVARWAERNIGSRSVRAAVEALAQRATLRPLRFVDVDCALAARARSKALARLNGDVSGIFDPIVEPRAGRVLRIGFVARDWELGPDTSAALARIEHLPAERASRVLFSTVEPVTGFAWHCREAAQEFHVLPSDVAAQVEFIRGLSLDVLIFVGEPGVSDMLSRLPQYRMAPLQLSLSDAGQTAGCCEIDGSLVATPRSAQRAERLCLEPMGTAAYALRRGGDFELEFSREDLGVHAEEVLFSAVLPSTHNTGDAILAFSRLLSGVPNSRLVLHVLPDSELPPVGLERFCGFVQAVMQHAGVAVDRISILAPEQATYDETRAIVRLGDIFIACAGSAIWSAEAMSVGIPVLAAGNPEAVWLHQEQLDGLVAKDTDGLVAIAAELAANPAGRTQLKEKLLAKAKSGLSCADSLAASGGFLGIVEVAFDQISAMGVAPFRSTKDPVTVGSDADAAEALDAARAAMDWGDMTGAVDAAQRALSIRPADAAIRALIGRAMLAAGRPDRASVYLLAAMDSCADDADLWFTLATAFRREGKNSEATQALESSLRLNPKRPDGWLMLIELAESAGAYDLAKDAFSTLRQVAPDCPQLAELAPRFET